MISRRGFGLGVVGAVAGCALPVGGSEQQLWSGGMPVKFCTVGHSIARGGGALGNEGFKCYVGDMMSACGVDWTNVGAYNHGGGVTQPGPHPHNAHSGVSGDTIVDVLSRWSSDVPLDATHAFLWIGVTDIDTSTVQQMQGDMADLLETAYAFNPGLRLWVREVGYRLNYDQKVADFDASLPGILASSSWPSSQINLFTTRTLPGQHPDGVHTDTGGHYQDAMKFFGEVRQTV